MNQITCECCGQLIDVSSVRYIAYMMHDNHTFTRLHGRTRDEVIRLVTDDIAARGMPHLFSKLLVNGRDSKHGPSVGIDRESRPDAEQIIDKWLGDVQQWARAYVATPMEQA